MDVEVEISRDVLYGAVRAISLSSFRQFKTSNAYRVLASLSIAVVLALGASAYVFVHNTPRYDYFSFLLIFILFVGYTVLFRYITSEFNRYIVYNSIRYRGTIRFRLDGDYLFVQDSSITSRFRLDSFYKTEETKDCLLLYIDIHQAVIVPTQDEKARELAALLKEKVKPAAA